MSDHWQYATPALLTGSDLQPQRNQRRNLGSGGSGVKEMRKLVNVRMRKFFPFLSFDGWRREKFLFYILKVNS
jgi:hypothetical protein